MFINIKSKSLDEASLRRTTKRQIEVDDEQDSFCWIRCHRNISYSSYP